MKIVGFAVVIVLLLIFVKVGKKGGRAKAKLQPPAAGRKLDPKNPYDICFALACLAGSVGDSFVWVNMQNEDKNRNADLIISAHLDTGPEGYFKTNQLTTMQEMENFFMPRDIAEFVCSIPFEKREIKSRTTYLSIRPPLHTTFPATESTANQLAASLRDGFSASVVARVNHIECRVEIPNNGKVELSVR